MKSLVRLWRGELPLADAFWNWAVIGGLVVNIVSSGLFLGLMMADQPIAALIAGYAPSLPYNFVATVGVWRSAGHYDGDKQWADAARLVTVVGMVLMSVT